MADFLLELLSEEIPARMQEKAGQDLARLFADEIGKAGLTAQALQVYATPRRLALIARGLPLSTESLSEEIKGPRADAPEQALAGFLKKTGLTRDQLVERADAKGNAILFAVIEKPGRATAEVLAQAIPAIVRGFPWPKSMRWGTASASTSSLRWVRPLQGIVALLGDDVVAFEIDGIRSGAATLGHRFHHPGVITIGNADDYAAKLRACHVIVDPEERRAIIAEGGARAAAAAGLSVVADEGLLAENAGLTEWPVPLLGSFDPAFLEVPREVIQLTMRTNQKYFALTDAQGELAPNFLCTANIEAADGGAAIVAGNRKVLAARLSDAKFFWEQDLKVPLAEQAKKLDQIVFHEKLGTVADKVERVAKLARWLVEEGIVGSPLPLAGGAGGGQSLPTGGSLVAEGLPTPNPSRKREGDIDVATLAAMAEQAARLCKADLVTGMVGEFPELQGVMGGYYARAEGLPGEVADAIRDHYKPVGQGDEVPTAPVTVAVSLADKLDTVAAFFAVDERPTGSRDPFALRRYAIGLIGILTQNHVRMRLEHAYGVVQGKLSDQLLYRAENMVFFKSLDPGPQYLGMGFSSDNKKLLVMSGNQSFEVELASNEQPFAEAYVNCTYNQDVAWPTFHSFFADRLKVQQREAGVRHDLIDAVFALGGEDDLVRLLARVKALQAFVGSEDGANLLAGYKRAANILRIEEKKDGAPKAVAPAQAGAHVSPDQATSQADADMGPRLRGGDGGGLQPEEAALLAALDSAEPRAAAAVAAEDFEGAMSALASLRAPIDAFFDKVTVNDPDSATRARRLALLARIRAAVHQVADFSRIEG